MHHVQCGEAASDEEDVLAFRGAATYQKTPSGPVFIYWSLRYLHSLFPALLFIGGPPIRCVPGAVVLLKSRARLRQVSCPEMVSVWTFFGRRQRLRVSADARA